MIGNLKPYPAYKDSGVPWLGEVPEHWDIRRGKNLFQCIDVRSTNGEEELLTVSSERGIIPRKTANVTMFKAESYAGHKLCWPGDLVINSLWAWAKGLGISQHHGIVSTAYGVYRIRKSALAPRFIHELVRSTPFQWELQVRSKGVWTSRLQLTDDSFLNAPFPVPPIEEQAQIATFLNYADRRIRRYIRSKQKLIKLLEEQKQVVINQAVTHGLDPNVPLKPSGIEWLGYIPEHWEVCRLRNILTDGPQNGISPPITEDKIGLESFSISAIRDGKLDIQPQDIKCVHHNSNINLAKYTLKAGDILLVRGNGNISLVGKAGIVARDMPGLIYPDILMRIRLANFVESTYMIELLNCRMLRDQIENAARTTVGTYKVNNQQIRQLWLALPPYKEQQAIIYEIKQKTSDVVASIDCAKQEISLLREFRTRLIADVVTGKLDVREAAAHLPAELDELEPLEDDLPNPELDLDTDSDLEATAEDEAA